jgi:hypothetical protein
MTAAMVLQIIAGVGGIITLLLQQYLSPAEVLKRKVEAAKDADEKLRKECNDLDDAAISVRLDGVLHPPYNPARKPDSGPKAG